MAPKKKGAAKKGAVKKKKKSSSKLSEGEPFEYEPLTIEELNFEQPEFIRCRICNTELNHLNFEWPVVPTSVTLSEVKQAIRQRHHGTVSDVTLFLEHVDENSMLEEYEEGSTLADIGVTGIASGTPEEVPTVTVYYDFPASHADDPLLSRSPGFIASKYGLTPRDARAANIQVPLLRPGAWKAV